MKFNSQICTTREQSQRLLGFGLKPETADMELVYNIFSKTYEPLPKAFPTANKCVIHAWSLHRLLEIICNKGCSEHYYFDFSIDYDSMEDVYNSIIEVIERHIKDKFFNKEYLSNESR